MIDLIFPLNTHILFGLMNELNQLKHCDLFHVSTCMKKDSAIQAKHKIFEVDMAKSKIALSPVKVDIACKKCAGKTT